MGYVIGDVETIAYNELIDFGLDDVESADGMRCDCCGSWVDDDNVTYVNDTPLCESCLCDNYSYWLTPRECKTAPWS